MHRQTKLFKLALFVIATVVVVVVCGGYGDEVAAGDFVHDVVVLVTVTFLHLFRTFWYSCCRCFYCVWCCPSSKRAVIRCRQGNPLTEIFHRQRCRILVLREREGACLCVWVHSWSILIFACRPDRMSIIHYTTFTRFIKTLENFWNAMRIKRKLVCLYVKITDFCIAQSTWFWSSWWAVLHQMALSGKYIFIWCLSLLLGGGGRCLSLLDWT